MRSHDRFEQLLFDCAQDICRISKSRDLIGTWNGGVSEWEDTHTVSCERYYCGDTDYDSVTVPPEYLYDVEYRKIYKETLIEEKERAVALAREREESRKSITYRVIGDERAEYERLKKKFGDE